MKKVMSIFVAMVLSGFVSGPLYAQKGRDVGQPLTAYAPEDFEVQPIRQDKKCLIRKRHTLREVGRSPDGAKVTLIVRQVAVLPNRLCKDESEFEMTAAWWDDLRRKQAEAIK